MRYKAFPVLLSAGASVLDISVHVRARNGKNKVVGYFGTITLHFSPSLICCFLRFRLHN